MAFACKALIVMDGEDVARWGGKFHGQMRSGDDGAKGVKRGAAEEDII